jgi:hypothetical protein
MTICGEIGKLFPVNDINCEKNGQLEKADKIACPQKDIVIIRFFVYFFFLANNLHLSQKSIYLKKYTRKLIGHPRT